MNTYEFLSYLRSLDVKLWVNDEQLRCSAPKRVLTPILQAELAERKAEILRFLYKAKHVAYSNSPPLLPVPKDENLPLSFAQQRLWFLAQLEPNSSAYNMPTAYRLTGLLNLTALEQSLNEIVRRHASLRTTFPSVDGQPSQVISPAIALTLPVIDLRRLPPDLRETEAQRQATKEAQQPFNLAQGPLLRVKLLHLVEVEHVLLLTLHHIVFDGWSYKTFFEELAALYEAFSTDKPSPLPELPIQYADFAHWQRQWLQGQVLKSQLDYWKQQLGGTLPVLQLPTDYPRSASQTHQGAKQSLELPKDLTKALKALCQQEGSTLFMTLLATFQTLLYRYSGQEDIIIGTPIAGRNQMETEALIGLFLNSLAIRTDLSGNPTFQQLLSRVREVALGAYAHQDLPFEKLVEELQPQRDLSRTPLFQVWFNMLNLPDNRLELPGLKAELLPMQQTSSKFDLTLYVLERNQEIQLQLVYNADLFAPKRMVEMLNQFQFLLQQIVDHPEEKITHFSLVTPKAESLLPSPAQPLSSEWFGAVQTRFSDQARRVPHQLAVVDTQVAWSYTELEQRTNQLANYLRKNGIQHQDIVAIYGHRSASLVWALLGVLKAGAAFVILDPAYPASRLIDCLGIAKPRSWLHLEAAGEVPAALQEFVSTLPCCCSLELPQGSFALTHSRLASYSTSNLDVTVDPDSLAYVAFTSGSTGKPKGILGTHRPLSHFLQWHCQTFELNQSDRFSMLSGLSHDPLLRDIFTPLWLGATLCIPKPKDIETPGHLADWMQNEQVSITHLTPTMGQLLTQTIPAFSEIPFLRYVFFSGDILTRRDVARIRKLAPRATCVNFYGATETPQAMGYFTIPSPGTQVQEGELASLKQSIPLGKGISDVQLLILNLSQQLAGIGEVGEIYVRTPYLAKGYIGDDELTQERFIVNPFTKTTSDLLYKTGDLGRYLPDSNIECLGRLDHQVKIRGFRIELAEVEAILGRHPAVREAVALAWENYPDNRYLVAYVIPNEEQKPTIDELRHFLKQKLPDYVVPSAFVLLDTLPLTPNGKVDRRALPAPKQARQEELEETFVSPRNEIELQLTKIWQKVLSIQPIGVKDNFFDLGGHSLLAVRLFAQIQKEFCKGLPLSTLFQAPTIEQLAGLLYQRRLPASWSSIVAIQPAGTRPPFFCVHEADGHVLCYRDLANHLGSEQPFYGLIPKRIDGKGFHSWIEDIAAHYAAEIRTFQPEGPYFLGGLCNGGVIAFEIAQQLHVQGQRVALLALFDAVITLPAKSSKLAIRDQVYRHVNQLSQLVHKEKLDYILQKAKRRIVGQINKTINRPIQTRLALTAYKIYLNNEHFFPQASKIPARAAFRLSRRHYRPQVYQEKVTLFQVSEGQIAQHSSTNNPYLGGWDELAVGGVEVYNVPGKHGQVNTLLKDPYVQVLASKLRACLDRAQTHE